MTQFKSQIREVINRNAFVSLALEAGFNAYLPVYDRGVDLILYNEQDNILRKVQLKGRWTIDRKYENRDIWIAFPAGNEWYLMPHDEMVKLAHKDGSTNSKSWTVDGLYSKPKLSTAMLSSCKPYCFKPSTFEDRLTWVEGDIQIVDSGGGKTLAEIDAENRSKTAL